MLIYMKAIEFGLQLLTLMGKLYMILVKVIFLQLKKRIHSLLNIKVLL